MFGNIPNLTEPQVPGGVVDRGVVREPVGELIGKSSSNIVSKRGGEAFTKDETFTSSGSCCGLFWLGDPLGQTVCGSIIGSKQGVQRFCISVVVGDTRACGVATHAKSTKAKAEPLAWYITSALRGKLGGRAALVDKWIMKSEVDPEFYDRFEEGKMEAEEWEVLFLKGRLAKQKITFDEKDEKPMDLASYYTPLKKKRPGSPYDDEASWVGVQSPSPLARLSEMDLDSLASPGSTQGKEINLKRQFVTVQQNFEKIEVTLKDHKEAIGEGLVSLQTSLNSLAIQVTSTERRVGRPSGFGSEFGVTNAFDGVRYLCERLDGVQDQFATVPYVSTVARLEDVETTLQTLQTQQTMGSLIQDAEAKILANKREVTSDLESLKAKFVDPVLQFYVKAMHSGPSIFARLEQIEKGVHDMSNDGNVFGALKYMGGFGGGGGSETGGPAHYKELQARLEVLETRNTELQGKLSSLESSGSRRSDTNHEEELPSGEGAISTLIQRLGVLESAQGGFDSVQMGGYHFSGPGDCEAFLRAEAPREAWGAFGYDMVSLLHRASVDPSTTAAILSRDYNAKKSGFPNMGSAFIYTSMQQSLPAPFGAPAVTGEKEASPLPALRTFEKWDKRDGQGGLKNVLYKANKQTVELLQGVIRRELRGFTRADLVFSRMITSSEEHFRQVANFLTETRNVCYHQNGDAFESWEYPCKVVRGVFDECMQVRGVGAERSSIDEFTLKDAGRMLWAALKCHKLMDDFVAANFQGHPTLAGYSIQYLFKHRLTPKDMEAVSGGVSSLKTEVKGLQATQQKLKTKVGLG
jgi:hypothetical protein